MPGLVPFIRESLDVLLDFEIDGAHQHPLSSLQDQRI